MPYQDNPRTGKLEYGTYVGGVFISDAESKKRQERIKDEQRRREDKQQRTNEYESQYGMRHIYETTTEEERLANLGYRYQLPKIPPIPSKLDDKYYTGCCFWQSFNKPVYQADLDRHYIIKKMYEDAEKNDKAIAARTSEENRRKMQFS